MPHQFTDLTGKIFNRLTVIGPDPEGSGHYYWIVRCQCGNEKSVRGKDLKRGMTQSCGCLRLRKCGRRRIVSVGMEREYTAYKGAKYRCTKPSTAGYKNYGGRGIEFRFTSFQQFLSHVGPKPSPAHSIDRIDNNGHYEVGNVRWATQKEQIANRRARRTSA